MLSVLRIVTGILFIEHGTFKLFGIPAGQPGNTPQLLSLLGIAAIVELIGGLLIVLGLFTRPTAFILSGEMAVAYFLMHASRGFWPFVNRGELAALYCFIYLFLAVAGGGSWSIDHLWLGQAETAPAVPTSDQVPQHSSSTAGT
jgi:putative oxidoreductase